MLIARAQIGDRVVDVRVSGDRVEDVAERLSPMRDEDVWDAGGGALLPGLHDHHLHLHAMAAAADSVTCGPPEVDDEATLAQRLRQAVEQREPGQWIRGVGYHESVAGDLDRYRLDGIASSRPMRVQHRSGALWMLNSAAIDALALRAGDVGVEVDETNTPTGRLWRADVALRQRLSATLPDLSAVSHRLLRLGITGATDATPDLDLSATQHLADSTLRGQLLQRLVLLGASDTAALPARVAVGPRKLLLPDHDLPSFDEIAAAVRSVHEQGRGVAVHCITRESLLLTLAVLDAVGQHPADRIEHAAVVPDEVIERMARNGLRVVTQPALVAERGDDYVSGVEPDDIAHLYRCGSLLQAGVRVALSSDAPYADPDPWRAIETATSRRTRSGAVVGAAERIDARAALAGYLSGGNDPGGAPRTVHVGVPADLCLLRTPLGDALEHPTADVVALVLAAGEPYVVAGSPSSRAST